MSQLPAELGRSDVAQCPIALHDPSVDHLIRWAKSGGDCPFHGDWFLFNIPSERQQVVLRERRLAIASVMKFNKARVGKAVGDMLKCYFANIPKDPKEFAMLVAKFVSELQDIPTWAVELGCMQIRLGNTPEVSPDFPPTTIRLREVCLPPVYALRSEADTIHRILMAHKAIPYVESEEAKRRVAEGLKSLADELRAKAESEREDEAKIVRQIADDAHDGLILAEYAAAGIEPVRSIYGLVAPSTLKSIGKWPKKAA